MPIGVISTCSSYRKSAIRTRINYLTIFALTVLRCHKWRIFIFGTYCGGEKREIRLKHLIFGNGLMICERFFRGITKPQLQKVSATVKSDICLFDELAWPDLDQ